MKGSIAKHLVIALSICAITPGVWAQSPGDLVFRQSFEVRAPDDAGDAAAFLKRATFGPTPTEIFQLQSAGFEVWIDQQMALTPTLHRPQLESMGNEIGQGERQRVWWDIALNASDQLRQRVAFALSEILVVSDVNGDLEGQPIALAEYYDILLRGAFGNYRDLIEQVTLTPTMGFYLSMFRSTRDASAGIEPDENYAREIMQLFSIGLVELELDGSVRLDGMGQPIPTYNQSHIVALAEAFTGWNFAGADGGDGDCEWWEWRWPEWNWLSPMEPCVITDQNSDYQPADYHVTTAKTIVGGTVLPPGLTPQQDLDRALDTLFNHPNVGPFLATRLIQRLVTSNPSAGYIQRVAQVFNNNGQGVRGDLGAVVRAILTDHEGLDAYALGQANFGKLREPLLLVTQLWRVYNAAPNPAFVQDPSCCWPGAIYVPQWFFGQAAMRSPSVFNFFRPDYSLPGAIQNANLVAPEFQISTETLVVDVANFFFETLVQQAPPNYPWQTEYQIDISALLNLANNPPALLDRLDRDLMGSRLNPTVRQLVINRLNAIDSNQPTRRVTEAIYYLTTSPQYLVQQ